jgi:hypothetical protein
MLVIAATGDRSVVALLVALGVMVAITIILWRVGRRDVRVAKEAKQVDLPGGEGKKLDIKIGDPVPSNVAGVDSRTVTRSWLRALVVGADNRLSTSKTTALAWTYVIAFGLITLLLAMWFGDDTGWQKLMDNGLQEEYLIALGGPFAAAVLAKYTAVSAEQNGEKPAAPPGSAGLGQLFANDAGEADLGDFQYVLFNAIALAYVLVRFVFHVQEALPDIPALLAGLALTSTGAYSAKKLLTALPATLTNVHPSEATPTGTVQVWGKNLVVAGSGDADPDQLPAILIGNKTATVTVAGTSPGGVNRLHVTVPDLEPGTYLLTAVRADGAPGAGPGGSTGLSFRVLAVPPPTQAAKKKA